MALSVIWVTIKDFYLQLLCFIKIRQQFGELKSKGVIKMEFHMVNIVAMLVQSGQSVNQG